VRSRRYRKSSCSSSSALSTARSGLTLAGAADATPAIHRCVRYRTLCSWHLSRGQHLRYRCPSENQTTLSDLGNLDASLRPWNCSVTSIHHMWPTAFNTLLHQFLRFRRIINNIYGSNWIWFTMESGALSGSWFTPCVARCQTNLEHEQVHAIQDPFSGNLSFFSMVRQIALLGASATLTYRFQLDESYIRCHVLHGNF
jgi:hypothetical protein